MPSRKIPESHRIAQSMFDICQSRGELGDGGRRLRMAEQTIFLLNLPTNNDEKSLLGLVALQFTGLLNEYGVDTSWYFPPWPIVLQDEGREVEKFVDFRANDVLGAQADGMPVATVIPISRGECFPYSYLENTNTLAGLAKILNVGFYRETRGLMAPIWVMPVAFFNVIKNVTYPQNSNQTIWEWERMGLREVR